PWTESNKPLLKALKIEHLGMTFVLGMTLLVGCFSITISLLLALRRKAREMAILRSTGLRKKDLGILFILKGFMIGVIGVTLGLSSGLGVLYLVSHVQIPFLTTAYHKETLPVLIQYSQIISVCVGSLILAMLAAVWPAIEVMRLDVVKTLSERK
ncbi:MAG: FtsX-like permease family protein, partial [Silvanigrellaceae bacterium]|nr:FtsX-like permease family protein [Silvanigrellaceae bacterium]